MSSIYKVAIAFILLLAIPAMAQSTTSNLLAKEPQPILLGHPPQPVGQVLHFSDLKKIWDNGKLTSDVFLNGSWKQIAAATTVKCGSLETDTLNLSGIKNSDGTIEKLVFSYVGAPSLTGANGQKVFSVRILNLESAGINQGPYRVDPVEPQFAQWAYGNGAITQSGYFEYSCRAVAGSNSQIICAESMIVTDPTAVDQISKDCASDQYGIIEVFSRE